MEPENTTYLRLPEPLPSLSDSVIEMARPLVKSFAGSVPWRANAYPHIKCAAVCAGRHPRDKALFIAALCVLDDGAVLKVFGVRGAVVDHPRYEPRVVSSPVDGTAVSLSGPHDAPKSHLFASGWLELAPHAEVVKVNSQALLDQALAECPMLPANRVAEGCIGPVRYVAARVDGALTLLSRSEGADSTSDVWTDLDAGPSLEAFMTGRLCNLDKKPSSEALEELRLQKILTNLGE